MASKTIQDVISTLESLRHPDTGCPWSLAQTFDSLTKHTLEETYELIDAVDQKNPKAILDELGDLLYQVLYYAQIATENQLFTLDDVCQNLLNKINSRYSQIDKTHLSPAEVNKAWLDAKIRTKPQGQSLLAGTSQNLPALMRATKIQEKAARCGFDWNNTDEVLSKVEEEIGELKQSIERKNQPECEEELGDSLFSLVNLARHLNLDAETVLRQATKKFMRRFCYMEQIAQSRSITLDKLSQAELEALWEKAKDSGL